MDSLLKKLCWFAVAIIFTASIGYLAHQSAVESIENRALLRQANVSVLKVSDEKAIKRSSTSAVQILSMGISGEEPAIAASSGTYFSYDNKQFVLTAAHGLIGSCSDTQIVVGEIAYECLEIVTMDPVVDYAILRVQSISERIPINIIKHTPRVSRLHRSMTLLSQVYYTGHPQMLGPLTFDGRIVGYGPDYDYLYIHSYAWSGSSGAGVFNAKGYLIGYILAISVAQSEHGYDVMEDLVIVVPINRVNFSALFE